MGDWLGGKSETNMTVYGETPGRDELGGDLSNALSGWLKGWNTGTGTTYPGLGEAGSLWDSVKGGAALGMGGLRDWMGPYKAPAGLGDIEAAERTQTERDIEAARKNTIMEFGSKGHTFSSPMVRAMMDREMDARTALQGRLGGYRYGDYQNWRQMQPQMIALALQQPAVAAQLLGQGGSQMVQALLQYLQASKGEPIVTQEQSKGLLDYAVPIAAGGLSGGSLSF